MHNEDFNADHRVLWAAQQKPIKREKRDHVFFPFAEYYDEIRMNHLNDFREPLDFNDELWEKQWYMVSNIFKYN